MATLGLRSWVLILTLAPTVLIGVLLGSYFTFHSFQQLDEELIERGSNIVEPLAIASEYGMLHNSREMLKRLVGVSHRRHSETVRAIAIFDTRHKVFVTSNYIRNFNTLRLPPGSTVPPNTMLEYTSNGDLILRTPIHQESNLYGLKPDEPTPIIGYVVAQLNSDGAVLAQHRSALAAGIIVMVGVILNLLFTFRLVKQVTEPISEMVDAVDMIRRGRLDTRVAGPLIGELDELRQGINAMAKSLDESHLEMQQNIDQATSDLRETLEQIEIQNIELDMAKKRAQEANRVKSEFLANMSHELRTPLNGVIGFTRQLLKTPMTPQQKDYLVTIEKSANNLLTIINDILDFSKLEAGKLQLEQMPFMLRDTIYEVATLLAPNSHEKGLEMVVRVMDKVPDNLIGDAFRIKQVLTNLVGNAVKFTDQGSVEISSKLLKEHEDKVTLKIMVTDTGIGVSEEQQKSLFQAFGQGDTSITRRFGGTGLGLVISQRLVHQMGGEMGFDSTPGESTTFWFTLCCTRSPLPLGEPLPLDAVFEQSVLIYEPQAASRRALSEPLLNWNINVVSVSEPFEWQYQLNSGQRFLATLISCASCEKDMSQMGQLIRQAKVCSNQVIVITNHSDPNIHDRLREQGADYSLAKPVSPSKVCRLVGNFKPAEKVQPVKVESKITRHDARVMAVDDNPANLKLIAALLDDIVNEVEICEDGEFAVEKAQKQSYDLILMDIQMPRMDGVTATQEIRKTELNRSTPIIAVTAHAMSGEQERLLSKGMDDYLTKPIDEEALQRLLLRWIPKLNSQGTSLATIDGIDWSLALKRAGGREALAQEMLQMLLDSLPEVKTSLDNAYQEQDREQLLHHVHKLNGACCYTGVPQLNKLANQLETLLKQGIELPDLEPELLEMHDEISLLLEAAKATQA
ncbi:two-component sensor histidine kinase BarA [Corallincola luteus]|uniref:histidine kinase n=2 Tax=Corallincola TaxID=1775176 RepID=A0A368NQA0_9GAMM|nr:MULTISPECIES: two-component sensor histidine kinase BarA [Corallincola]RCU51864.1 two-component sensor histidine kinase BarA [Corallincola holothuriorum]TCI05015.1 two-component sensor histidine kinase BarA [Corallincola luteus]